MRDRGSPGHETTGRIIAIGDIHGCVHALDALIAGIQPRSDDQIVCLGDVIDNGRDTALVLDRLLELERRCDLVCIKGNHEEMLLAVLDDNRLKASWEICGGVYTLNSYRFGADLDVIPEAHIDFIRSFRDYHETAAHIFTHANYEADLPLADQPVHALRWSLLGDVAPTPHCSGKIAIVGHTEQRGGEIADLSCVKCIDTYCWGYRWLTALDVQTGQVWQASRWGALRESGETIEGLEQSRKVLKGPAALNDIDR